MTDGATQQYEKDTPEWYFRCAKCGEENSIPMNMFKEEPRICLDCSKNLNKTSEEING